MRDKQILSVHVCVDDPIGDLEVGDFDFGIPILFYDSAKIGDNRRKIADMLLNASIQVRNNLEPFKDLPEEGTIL